MVFRTMAAAQAAENCGDEWGLTWYSQWGIYTSILTQTDSQNSLAAVEALSLNSPQNSPWQLAIAKSFAEANNVFIVIS